MFLDEAVPRLIWLALVFMAAFLGVRAAMSLRFSVPSRPVVAEKVRLELSHQREAEEVRLKYPELCDALAKVHAAELAAFARRP